MSPRRSVALPQRLVVGLTVGALLTVTTGCGARFDTEQSAPPLPATS